MKRINILLIILAVFSALPSISQVPDDLIAGIKYRATGPTRQSGRFVDFAVVESSPKVFYAATASGGLWKTVNNGISFKSIFDNESVVSIGDVEVAPSDSSIVWVGSGEANNSRSSYWGDGVYKSVDGGMTWKNMGLPESHHIGRILIHPENPNIVYVAALGHLYSDNEERGLYKSTDGGNTWTKVLDVVVRKKNIGVVDVAMSPDNPNVLFAATFDKIRTPWTYNEGGPGSAIYKSTDAGATWTKLEGGLPGGFLGRIGVAISQSNPSVVYANIENVNVEGMKDKDRLEQLLKGIPLERGKRVTGVEMYRSDDGGDTWRKVSPDGEDVGGGPAYYYQQVRIDPQDPDHVYVLGIRMWETVNGGEEWVRPFTFGGDNHAMWIDPKDSKHMLLGYDHGMGVTYDGGKNWYHPDELPLAQFYAVGIDMERPYNVYGGLQDNGSVKGPSTKKDGSAIRMEDWYRVGGGDGMYNVVDPTNSRWLYNESQFGPLRRIDQVTGESKSIAYQNENRQMRWNWNSPILISPHDPATIYHAGNKVVKSTNRGESWEEISPDLTTNDPDKIRGTGNIQYCTITSLEESPLEQGVLWVGTDDGNVHVSRDGGKNWTKLNENISGNPGYWVSRIEASNHVPGRAYLTYTGYRRDDFKPFVYMTDDYGKSWKRITNGLPDEPVNVIREDHKNPDLLFIGTEMRVMVSLDRGASWQPMRNNMPTNPVHDLVVHPRENELVVATHGRGIFIADIQPLQDSGGEMGSPVHLFPVKPRIQYVTPLTPNSAFTNFNGESLPTGSTIHYYVSQGSEEVKFEIYQGDLLIQELKGSGEVGLQSVVWNHDRRVKERSEEEKKQYLERAQRFRAWMGDERYKAMIANADYIMGSAGTGNFTVKITTGNQSLTSNIQVLEDEWSDR